MRAMSFRRLPLLGLLFAFAPVAAVPACSSGGGTPADAGSDAPLKPLCTTAAKWQPGTKAFSEATAGSGIEGAIGTRIVAVDFDGDGWTDLAIRNGGAADDFAPGGKRTSFLLRNVRGKFEDVTQSSGFRQRRDGNAAKGRPGEVVAFGDVDNDGDLDAFTGVTTATGETETSELLLNNGDGTFSLGPATNPFRLANDSVSGVTFVDFDRDGNLDLWITESAIGGNPQQSRLYKGDGGGNFTDATTTMGLRTKNWGSATQEELDQGLGHAYAWSGAACDIDDDGNPELLAGSYGRAPNHLWHSLGPAVPYHNDSTSTGYSYDKGVDWTDNESARCWCKLNPMDTDCGGVPPPANIPCNQPSDAFRWNHATDRTPFRLGGNTGTTLCADMDNDGKIDLVTCEIKHWDVGSSSDEAEILFNTGKPAGNPAAPFVFERPGNAALGLARSHKIPWDEGIMTGSVFDFDNDGWLDLYWGDSDYPGARGLLYHQKGPRSFEAVPITDGIDHLRSHGSAVADFDRDGDLDIVVGHSFARCQGECYPTQQARLFSNQMGGNFVELRLLGAPGTNRAAIGARVTVEAGGVKQIRDVGGGFGHYGMQDDLVVHVGLGAACTAKVTVRWPDAPLSTQTFEVPAGYRFVVEQGKGPVPAPK
jgi:hypothetical protein